MPSGLRCGHLPLLLLVCLGSTSTYAADPPTAADNAQAEAENPQDEEPAVLAPDEALKETPGKENPPEIPGTQPQDTGLRGAAKILGLPDFSLEARPRQEVHEKPAVPMDANANLTPDSILMLTEERGWPAGTIREQLDKDATLVPYGKGAIFVPSMTQGLDEPPVTVWLGNDKVADSTSGVRIVLPPGEYFVQMGSGSVELRFGRIVVVRELKTTIVPVTWSGITVHVVDAQLNSLRNSYELIRMSDREYLGAGFGADEQTGEHNGTWILQPGLYKIVRVGGTYRDRTDFATVRLVPGAHVEYLLVQDATSGDFQGAGEARAEELFRPGKGFAASLILGGDGSLNWRESVVGYPDGDGWNLQGFLDTKLQGEIAGGPMLLRLQVVEGQTRLPGQIWLRGTDLAQLDALYIYNWRPWAGPYIRGYGVTNLFSSVYQFPSPATTVVTYTSGETVTRNDVHYIKLSPSLGSTTFKEGLGMNWRLIKTIFGEATVRSGFGFQQTINRGAFQETSSEGLTNFYTELPSGNIYGIELTLIAAARITRYVVINTVIDALIPFSRTQRVDLQIQGTLGVKLTQYAAVNLVLNYHSGPLIPKPIFELDTLLRFSLEIL